MWSTPLLVTLIVAPTTPGRGESSVGVTGGLTLSGDQDVKIVEPRVGSTESHDVTAALGPVGGTTASLWRAAGRWPLLGNLDTGRPAPLIETGARRSGSRRGPGQLHRARLPG